MDHRPPPDGCEKLIRFGCGLVFGGLVLLFTLPQILSLEAGQLWIAVGLGAVICGLLAMRYGDDFYAHMSQLFHWW